MFQYMSRAQWGIGKNNRGPNHQRLEGRAAHGPEHSPDYTVVEELFRLTVQNYSENLLLLPTHLAFCSCKHRSYFEYFTFSTAETFQTKQCSYVLNANSANCKCKVKATFRYKILWILRIYLRQKNIMEQIRFL